MKKIIAILSIIFTANILFADTTITITVPTDYVQRILDSFRKNYVQEAGESNSDYAKRVVRCLIRNQVIKTETEDSTKNALDSINVNVPDGISQ